MDILTFIASIIKSVTWPLASIVIVILFRKQLSLLLKRMRKGKVGPAEFEFEQEIKELVEQVPIPLQPTTPIPTVSLATTNPRAAILEAWLNVENSAHHLISSQESPFPGTVRNITYILRSLEKRGILNFEDVTLFNNLRSLRNQAVHDIDFNPSADSAIQFVQLANGLKEKLNFAATRQR